jgi:hypothetical protein
MSLLYLHLLVVVSNDVRFLSFRIQRLMSSLADVYLTNEIGVTKQRLATIGIHPLPMPTSARLSATTSDCSGKAQKQLYSNLQTRPLVREGATNLQTRKCRKEISRRKKNRSQVPDGRLTPGQTGRLIVGRKLTHSLTL